MENFNAEDAKKNASDFGKDNMEHILQTIEDESKKGNTSCSFDFSLTEEIKEDLKDRGFKVSKRGNTSFIVKWDDTDNTKNNRILSLK